MEFFVSYCSLSEVFKKRGYRSSDVHTIDQVLYTVLPAKSDSDFMFCLQSYQGLIIDRSLVY